MCGIVGYYLFDGQEEQSGCVVSSMMALQRHRGPDDSGIAAISTRRGTVEQVLQDEKIRFKQPANLLFGFNRLSILDLSANGHQPMMDDSGNVILMLNGEIYNAFDFKTGLMREGYHFKSTTDTEVVLNLYLKYGMEKMIRLLNGMFAIAIWDNRIKTLFLARDRFGIKPLYVLRQDGRLAFSSEMKSFGELPGFSFELDESRLNEFLLFRNAINDTLFKGIRNCTPGTYLSVTESGEVREQLYYNINDEGAGSGSSNGSIAALESALHDSVSRQMISDVKLGCQLSGGVDSSLVTYYAKKSLAEGRLETISIKFSNPHYSEERYIDEVAGNLNLVSHKYEMSPEYYFNELERATWHFEQPLNHPNTIGIYLLSQEAKKHVTVLLSGEGADEALAGYERFTMATKPKYLNRTFFSRLRQNSSGIRDFLKYYRDNNLRLIMESAYGNIQLAASLYPDFDFESGVWKRKQLYETIDGDCVQKQRKYEILTYLPDLLMRQDKMSMAHSIENRVPFLDNQMIEAAFTISDEKLVGNRNGKTEAKLLLKQLCHQKFGERFAYRRKNGFGIPLRDFMSTPEFKEWWKDELEPGIRNRGVFRVAPVARWMANIEKANPQQLDAIWLMTGFEIWAKKYLDR